MYGQASEYYLAGIEPELSRQVQGSRERGWCVCVCVLCLPQPCARWLSQLGQVRIAYKSVHYEPAGAAGPRQLSPKHQSVNCKQ